MAKMIAKGLIHVAMNRDILKHDRFTILGLQSISGDVRGRQCQPPMPAGSDNATNNLFFCVVPPTWPP